MPVRLLPSWSNNTLTYEQLYRGRAEIQANIQNSMKKEKNGGVNSVRTE